MTAYRELRVVANGDHIDLLEEILFLSEAVSVTLDDDGDTPILEPPLGTHPVWPRTVVIAAYHDTRSDQVILADLSRSLVATGLQIELPKQLRVIADEDWVRISLDQFQPTEIGGFWVVPTWHAVPDHAHGPVLRLDPGLAFGTGYHPTTALCLAWLASADLAGRALLDFGAGSGILAIAGGLRGASPLVALDIDPQALDASAHNAQLNDLSLTCCLPDALPLQHFDVVIANILANPLIELAETLMATLTPGGSLVLAGLLDHQADAVQAAYPAIAWDPPVSRDGWTRLSGHCVPL